jgi:hypothetical protein
MDTVVTSFGREQLANGGLQVSFISFTDGAAFYQADAVSGSADASARIYFEADSMPFDRITFKSDESGFLQAPGVDPTLSVIGGRFISGSGESITGSALMQSFQGIMSSSLDNFRKNTIIGSADIFSDDNDFQVSPNVVTFNITDSKPFVEGDITTISITDVESIFQDKRLSHHINFAYLPPVNTDGTELGEYPRLGQGEVLTFDQLGSELIGVESSQITFPETSRTNNLIMQLFDVRDASITKLDLIDFGEFPSQIANSPGKQVFFAGRMILDEYGADTYVNIFTLVFE